MVIIEPHIQTLMQEDALQAFPDECCGFLFGTEDSDDRIFKDILVVNNAKEGDKRRRFEISAKDYLKAERYASDRDLTLLGVYHSHPNHPAIPSEHDRVAAQPYFSYIIVSVYDREIKNCRSWRLSDDEQFEEEIISEHTFSTLDEER